MSGESIKATYSEIGVKAFASPIRNKTATAERKIYFCNFFRLLI